MEELHVEVPCTHKILLNDFALEEQVNFSLVLLKGTIRVGNINNPCNNNQDNAIQLSNTSANKTSKWPVVKNSFKCLADLNIGENGVVLKYCRAKLQIKLHFYPRKTNFCVTPLYIICKGHNGHFQAPNNCDNSVESACLKIGIGARLIQCLTAEKLYECGYERKTFQLESDLKSVHSDCVQFHSNLSVSEAQSMAQEELWTYLGREIMSSSLSSSDRKFLAFLSCTKWDGVSRKVKAHAALGGGGLALFGTACLHTWPSTVEDVTQCFLNPTLVDTKHLMDDSCYRGTYGACFATTLGSVCHELGHTFDLGHPQTGIMGRGFDNVHLVFVPDTAGTVRAASSRKTGPQCTTVKLLHNLNVECVIGSPGPGRTRRGRSRSEAARSRSVSVTELNNRSGLEKADDLTHWSPGCAAILAYHKWFNTEKEHKTKDDLLFDRSRSVVTSSAGLRVVEVRGAGGTVLGSWQFPGTKPRNQFLVPAQTAVQPSALLVIAQDNNGNLIRSNLNV